MKVGDTIVVQLDFSSNGSLIAPAIVTRVWSEDKNAGTAMVNATAFPDLGAPKLLSSVTVHQSEDAARASNGFAPFGWLP